jgi:hypothetical protein
MLRIVKSFLTIAVVAAIAVGATGALFSDEVTSVGNTFSAGTLELDVQGRNVAVESFSFPNLKPGDCGGWSGFQCDYESKRWTVKNTGTLGGTLTVNLTNFDPAVSVNPNIAKQIRPQLRVNGGWASESSNLTNLPTYTRVLAAGETIVMDYAWSFSSSAGNEYQEETTSFDVVFHIDQL